MAIEPTMFPAPEGEEIPEEEFLDVELGEGVMMDDGSMVFEEIPEADTIDTIPFDGNLAEVLPREEISAIATEAIGKIEAAKNARKDWWRKYQKGLDLLGLNVEEMSEPWPGAAGMYHPVLTEAVVRFQANAVTELFPPKGPVKTKIIGRVTDQIAAQAKRVEQDMNYVILEKMPGYRDETERMLFNLPLAGSAFKKVYYSGHKSQCMSQYISADDVIVPYGVSTLEEAEIICHRYRETENNIFRRIESGEFADVPVMMSHPDVSDTEEARAEQAGEDAVSSEDDRHLLYEVHCLLDVESYDSKIKRPYIVTIDAQSEQVYSIYRNWTEGSNSYEPVNYFVHYKYLPGFGFYGMGLIHLIGGLTEAATLILRQLVDAGTLTNLPAGLKTRGMRFTGADDDAPLRPGELRDVDIPGDSIRDNIFMLPFKEPSNVLYSLLTDVVNEARNLAAVPDIKVSDMNSEAPVGTALAIIERSMKVLSAVQARIHASFKEEVNLIAGVIRDYYPPEYPFEVKEPGANRVQDYDDRVDVIPVTNPNSVTMAQRVMLHQAALQLSQQNPEIYDEVRLHRKMLEALGYEDVEDVLPLPEDRKPVDPVTENRAAIALEPLKAFMYQDHDAHIQVHMNFLQDPMVGKTLENSPNQQAIASHMMSHISEHLGWKYRAQIEQVMGTPLPPPEEPLPPEIEVELSRLVAEASGQLLGRNQQMAEQEQAQEMAQDPVLQLQIREQQLKEAEHERKREQDRNNLMVKLAQIEAGKEEAGVEAGVDLIEALIRAAESDNQLTVQQVIEGARLGTKAMMDMQKTEKGSQNQ